MSALAVIDEAALALPEVTKELVEGRRRYLVARTWFCFHRARRKDTGELTDVFVFRVEGSDEKELLLADARGIFFSNAHWATTAAVLARIAHLDSLGEDELRELVVGAWLARAPKRVAKAWLAGQEAV